MYTQVEDLAATVKELDARSASAAAAATSAASLRQRITALQVHSKRLTANSIHNLASCRLLANYQKNLLRKPQIDFVAFVGRACALAFDGPGSNGSAGAEQT